MLTLLLFCRVWPMPHCRGQRHSSRWNHAWHDRPGGRQQLHSTGEAAAAAAAAAAGKAARDDVCDAATR